MFSKRHYEAIATALQEAYRAVDTDEAQFGVFLAQERIADAFGLDNSAFKRGRFKKACEQGANVRART